MRFFKRKPCPSLEELLARRLQIHYETLIVTGATPVRTNAGRPVFRIPESLREFIEARGFEV